MKTKTTIVQGIFQEVDANQISTVFITGDIVEVITPNRTCTEISKIRKINRNGYVNIETGEYFERQIRNVEQAKEQHIRRSYNNLRRILNMNFSGSHQELFITLTYNSPMLDYYEANLDFKNFWRKFKYRYENCEYVRIIEPQKNGSWHFHVLVKQIGGEQLYVSQKELYKMWEHGAVHVKHIPFKKNFANYFFADPTSKNDKARDKGYRIRFYPPNFQFYSCSKGIIIPKPIKMTHAEIMKLVGNGERTYGKTKYICKGDKTVNIVTYEQFKK